MFEEDQAIFFRKTQGAKEKKGKVPKMKNFEDFREDETQTPHRKWMNMVARKLSKKVTDVQEFKIDDKKLYEMVKKRKNWTAPGIDGIQNFWWKKLTETWKAITDCFTKWMEWPEEIHTWLTQGQTVLLAKTEDVSNKKNYHPITCLNTVYKIFTRIIGSYMKNKDRNNIWDESQLGTCSGVVGTVDQLVKDNAITDKVREKQRNLAVAFYDYQKAHDMVQHDWMLRVYRWMGVPEKVVNAISKLMSGWKTRFKVTDNGKTTKTTAICIVRGFLQGDSYSLVAFCLTEVPVAMLMKDMGWVYDVTGRIKRCEKNTQSVCR